MRIFPGLLFFLTASLVSAGAARADEQAEYEASGLIGTVIVSGDANENVGDLQLGASGEVSWDNFVLGLRGTRTRTPRGYDACALQRLYELGSCFPFNVRTIGLDAGYEWDLKPIHFSPRLGVGYADDTDGTYRAGYLEPGFVLSAQYGAFVFGMDVRYRASLGFDRYSGLVEYLRVGLRI